MLNIAIIKLVINIVIHSEV